MKKIFVILFVWCTTVTLYAHTDIKIEKLSQHDYREVIDICQQLQQAGYNLDEVFDEEKTFIGDGVLESRCLLVQWDWSLYVPLVF